MAPISSSADQKMPSTQRILRQLFLTLFLRGQSARGLQSQSAPKSVGEKLVGTILLYALCGTLAISFHGQPIFMLSAYLHAMTLMFLGMFVGSSAGEILFNQQEADILLHRPIAPQSLLRAKVRVLAEVSLWMAGAFNLVGLFVGAVSAKGGWWFFPVHAASTALQALFCTGSVVLVYQLCLRWFGRERLEGLMTTAQVVLTVGVVLISQVLPQMFTFREQLNTDTTTYWWVLLLPPAWFAGIDDALTGTGSGVAWLLAAIALLATGTTLYLAVNKLARDYHLGLQTLSEKPTGSVTPRGRLRGLDRLTNLPPLRWWLRDPRERAAFLLTVAYLIRDRDVKLRVYPAVAPFLVFPVIFLVQGLRHNNGSMGGGFGLAFAGCYAGIIPLMLVQMLQYSQNWQAADVFRVAPMPGPSPICHGARTAVLSLFTFPMLIVLAVCVWFIQQDISSLALLLPGVILLPLLALIPNLGGKAVLLSQPIEEAKSASRALTMMGSMFATMAISGIALFARSIGWFWLFVLVEAIVVAVAYFWLRRNLNQAAWSSID